MATTTKPARPSCSTCPFYCPTDATIGQCRHDPVPVQKYPDEWCGRHPAMGEYIRPGFVTKGQT